MHGRVDRSYRVGAGLRDHRKGHRVNFSRDLQRAIAKRLALVIVAAFFAWFGVGRVHAQDYSSCYSNSLAVWECPDRETAYREVKRAAVDYLATIGRTLETELGYDNFSCGASKCYIYYRARATNGYVANAGRMWALANECPAGKPWDDITKTCGSPCADAPPLGPNAVSGTSGSMCSNGCKYRQKVDPAGDFSALCMGSGASMFCAAKGWEPTGETCEADQFPPPKPYDPEKPVCATMAGGTFNECVRPDGRHCVTSAAGRTLCWGKGETGPRSTADGKEGADRQESPNTTSPPSNMKNPTPAGSSITTIDGRTYNSNTYNGDGSTGGQSNTGDGGKDDGPGGKDGDMEGLLGQIKGAIDKIGNWIDGLGSEAGGLDTSQGDDVDPDTAWIEEEDPGDLNAGGYGWGRSCPPPPSISVPGGGQLDFSLLCSAASMFGALILAAAYVQAAFIIGRN